MRFERLRPADAYGVEIALAAPWAVATDNACGQRRKNGLARGRHPAFAPVMHELCLEDQFAHIAALVAFEPGAGRHRCRQDLLARNTIHVALGAARLLLQSTTCRLWVRCLVHAGGAKRRARWKVFQSGDLVAQQLVLHLQPGVVQAPGCILFAQCRVLGFQLHKPSFGHLDLLHQTRHQATQRIQRKRVGMFGRGQALLHDPTESGFVRSYGGNWVMTV